MHTPPTPPPLLLYIYPSKLDVDMMVITIVSLHDVIFIDVRLEEMVDPERMSRVGQVVERLTFLYHSDLLLVRSGVPVYHKVGIVSMERDLDMCIVVQILIQQDRFSRLRY